VVRLVIGGRLRSDELWTFAYECDSQTAACCPSPWADRLVDLTKDQLADKKRIIRETYGYRKDSFEVKACVSPEAFRRIQIIDKEKPP